MTPTASRFLRSQLLEMRRRHSQSIRLGCPEERLEMRDHARTIVFVLKTWREDGFR
jgi:hypothetical protein